MSETQFAELFTESVDVIFAFHGFPGAIHQVVHGPPDADRFHVRGFIEQGTTTTPFDMTALNRLDQAERVAAWRPARCDPVSSVIRFYVLAG